MIKDSVFLKKFKASIQDRTILNGILFATFSFINRGLGFLLLFVLAKFFTPGNYGSLNLYNTLLMFLSFTMALSTEGYLGVAYFKDGIEGTKKAYTSILLTSCIVLIICTTIICIANDAIPHSLNLSFPILCIAAIVGFSNIQINANLDYYRIQNNLKNYGFTSCGYAFLNAFIAILFITAICKKWEGVVYAQLISSSLFGASAIYCFSKSKNITKPDWNYWKKMLIWGIPLIPHAATNFLRQGCDRYIINNYHSLDEVGLFSFALNLCNVIIMLGLSFNQSSSVEIYRVLGSKEFSDNDKISKINALKRTLTITFSTCTLLVCLGGYCLVPTLLPAYTMSSHYFLLLSVYGLLQCYYYVYTNFLFFYKKTNCIMAITFASSILHLVLSLFFTRYSLYMTCLVYIVTQFVILILIRYFANKEIKKNILFSDK